MSVSDYRALPVSSAAKSSTKCIKIRKMVYHLKTKEWGCVTSLLVISACWGLLMKSYGSLTTSSLSLKTWKNSKKRSKRKTWNGLKCFKSDILRQLEHFQTAYSPTRPWKHSSSRNTKRLHRKSYNCSTTSTMTSKRSLKVLGLTMRILTRLIWVPARPASSTSSRMKAPSVFS